MDAGIQAILESLVDASIRRVVPSLKNVMFEDTPADDVGLSSCHLRVLGTVDDVQYQFILDEEGNHITCGQLRRALDDYTRRDDYTKQEQAYLDLKIDLMHFPLDKTF